MSRPGHPLVRVVRPAELCPAFGHASLGRTPSPVSMGWNGCTFHGEAGRHGDGITRDDREPARAPRDAGTGNHRPSTPARTRARRGAEHESRGAARTAV